jgi:hypothetical protein
METPGEHPARAQPPRCIVLKRDRDLGGRQNDIWVRRVLLGLVLMIPLAAVLNAFGQRPQTSITAGEAASLKVYAPARVRPGDIFEARFTVFARRTLRRAALRLDPGWFEGMSINSIEPQPQREASDPAGRPILTLGRIGAGQRARVFIYFQANPTNVGHRAQDVDLLDRGEMVAHVDRTITIFP